MKEISFHDEDFAACISDLVSHEMVWSMGDFIQHADISCLEHSFYVSYISYLMCRRLGLDYHSAARGGLLHDFFLYDWHGTGFKGMHGLKHPRIALNNAKKYFKLNDIEKDIIKKHMWPLTVKLPIHKEAVVVLLADKYCTCMEILRFGKRQLIKKIG